ncbi:MAG TPA: hypothetical protein VM537_12285 [Anaerolineae bacterium]|nr:hypothetical protein [Anaerolineae bacterium]
MTETAYKVVRVLDDGRMVSVYAGNTKYNVAAHVAMHEYALGREATFPSTAPGSALDSLSAALEFIGVECGRGRLKIMRVRCGGVTHEHPTTWSPIYGCPGILWATSITPICIVNADGTETFPAIEPDWHMGEKGAEHRVVTIIDSSPSFRRFLVPGKERSVALLDLNECEALFGTSEVGTEIEVRVVKRPEPEQERVVPNVGGLGRTVWCPKCQAGIFCGPDSLPGSCYKCGVLFAKEDPDA